ncbi:MAG: zinc-ribbon domain-containing protein [Candidatus Obscuribacterales bacterium]|nr:zinc-ribbon domain-containing protein [Candidatus Obscuribacterales bacterium]
MGRSIPIEELEEPHPHNRRRPPISVTHPHLTIEWHYKKNRGFGPEDFTSGSDVAPWWRCQTNAKHIWQSSVQLRASRGHGCPYCSTRRLSPEKTLARLFPAVAKQWHPAKNKKLTPADVAAGSNHLAWWLCPKCGNEWQAAVANRTSGNNCYRCAKNVLDLRNYPHALKYFDRKANKGLDPHWLSMHFVLHWRCPKAKDHVWTQTFTKKCSVARFCPFCSFRKVCKSNCLAKLYPEIAKEWHPKKNGKLTPDMVTAQSGTSVFWLCQKCNHTYQNSVHNRTVRNRGCIKCWHDRASAVIKEAKAQKKLLRTKSKQKAK